MLSRFVFVYLDDILIFSRTLEEHRQHMRLVLHRLLEDHLYFNPVKCEFHSPSVSFLSYIIAKGQVRPDPTKIQAVVDGPIPTSQKDLQRFLGFAKFLALLHPNPSLQSVVEADASDTGVGAVLSQRDPATQKLHPYAFFHHLVSWSSFLPWIEYAHNSLSCSAMVPTTSKLQCFAAQPSLSCPATHLHLILGSSPLSAPLTLPTSCTNLLDDPQLPFPDHHSSLPPPQLH
ncbi:uncharacterized protein K02A2.6-like [Plectropomus leopardus]|uniref:uncharacterized protein K02A2.6-like n=1 Tax=Plectropomus leopardus TaxID=160734 RepID=UPI001C4C0BB1|nr:uncharacterized protein K02A2.6-like [Plectropomus leopardus]